MNLIEGKWIMTMAKGYTKKVLIISLLLVVIAGVVIIVAINRDRIGNQDSGYGAHLRSGKAVIVDIPSDNCIVVEIMNCFFGG